MGADMSEYQSWLRDIPERAANLLPRWRAWCGWPTPSSPVPKNTGWSRFAGDLENLFAPLVDHAERPPLDPWETIDEKGLVAVRPLGPALRFFRGREAPLQIFLGIHTDVVYPGDSETSVLLREEGDRFYAPGAADAKGGILVLWLALEAFLCSPWAAQAGFEILLNPDEEVGSPGSAPLLREAAARNHLGLLFEPALPDGALVSRRKGSGNFTVVLRGRGGHAGRDAVTGRNALHGLAEFITALTAFAAGHPGVTANVGRIDGGGPVNRIADLGVARFNVRVDDDGQMRAVREFLARQSEEWNRREGFAWQAFGDFTSPPKAMDGASGLLLQAALRCGEELGLALQAVPSGGVCDGNKLAGFGLPNIDTLGAVGGGLHGNDEWASVASLTERAGLTALLLMKLAAGEIGWKMQQ